MHCNFFPMQHPIHPKAKVIRELMKETDTSLRILGEKTGLAYNLINPYLKGLRKPHREDAFEVMERVLHEIQREKVIDGTLDVIPGKGIRVPIIEYDVDVNVESALKQVETNDLSVSILITKPVGKPWGRAVVTRALEGLLKPGDVAIMDQRAAEPGQVVEVFMDGRASFGILAGAGRSLRLTFTSPDFPDVPIVSTDIRGVVVAKRESRPNDAKALVEYPHGMTISDKM
jgi:hypothetical protein